MKTKITRRWALVAALAVLALVAAACGDDDDDDKATSRTVTAADYAFRNLPKEVKAGSRFALTNESTKELHEMVAFRIPDNEKRPVSEILKLPEEQQNAIFQGEPAMVLLAPPNKGPQIQAVGDGRLTEKGRYAIVCSIPTGADPNAFLNAPPGEGPPQVAGGPPHFTQGMFAELKVT